MCKGYVSDYRYREKGKLKVGCSVFTTSRCIVDDIVDGGYMRTKRWGNRGKLKNCGFNGDFSGFKGFGGCYIKWPACK